MKLFNFHRLIKKYTVLFTLQRKNDADKIGYDEDLGEYEMETPNYYPIESAEGALIPLQQYVIYNSGGRLTAADRMLYTFDSSIPMKSLIRYRELTYSVEEKTAHDQYADFTQYTLKAVDAFYD